MSEDDQHVQEAVSDVADNNNVNDPPSPASDRYVRPTVLPTYDQLPPQYSAVDQSSDSAGVVSGSLAEPTGGKKNSMAPTSETEDCADQTCGQVECERRCEVVLVRVDQPPMTRAVTTSVEQDGAVLHSALTQHVYS